MAPKAFDFTREVAIVSGAGSRMKGSIPRFQSFNDKILSDSLGEIGNGRATSILLARQGAKVALIDSNVEWAQNTKEMIDAEGGISEVIEADVTNEASCRRAVAKTVELFGNVHILVNVGMSELLSGLQFVYTDMLC
jgi:NAD(P)-dependent dehydrogenase (short-subunit alcohol dehydrogenase family)